MSRTQKPILVWSPAARRDLIRLREFIELNNPHAARRSSERIRKAANLVLDNPAIGTRIEGREDYELFTPFGRYGYILRYQIVLKGSSLCAQLLARLLSLRMSGSSSMAWKFRNYRKT